MALNEFKLPTISVGYARACGLLRTEYEYEVKMNGSGIRVAGGNKLRNDIYRRWIIRRVGGPPRQVPRPRWLIDFLLRAVF